MPVPRHSSQRQAVLFAVKMRRDFPTADQVYRSVRTRLPTIGVATVYRNLEHLRQRGEIASFEGPDRVARYVGFVVHQATFTCQRCGSVETVRLPNLERAVEQAAGSRTVSFSRLDIRGLCRRHAGRTQPGKIA